MGRRRDARFISSGVKVQPAASAPSPDPAPVPTLLSAALPFAHIGRAIDAAVGRGREVIASYGIKLPSAASSPSPPRAPGVGGRFRLGAKEEALLPQLVADERSYSISSGSLFNPGASSIA